MKEDKLVLYSFKVIFGFLLFEYFLVSLLLNDIVESYYKVIILVLAVLLFCSIINSFTTIVFYENKVEIHRFFGLLKKSVLVTQMTISEKYLSGYRMFSILPYILIKTIDNKYIMIIGNKFQIKKFFEICKIKYNIVPLVQNLTSR